MDERKVEEEEVVDKAHIAVYVCTKELVGIIVTDEGVGDSKEFENVVSQAEHTVNKRKINRATKSLNTAAENISRALEVITKIIQI
ncbi:MAG: hypothetical protein HXS47_01475 [Theionarchaea archaeon]|nr:hypothetical protein [Theionarchaea archaeon]